MVQGSKVVHMDSWVPCKLWAPVVMFPLLQYFCLNLLCINKLLMMLNGCLFFINYNPAEAHKKNYQSFYWIQVVGDEWPERLFTLPKWIMKNVVNLVPLSKHILNSDYGKNIVPYIVAMSKDILCDGHLLLYHVHFSSV